MILCFDSIIFEQGIFMNTHTSKIILSSLSLVVLFGCASAPEPVVEVSPAQATVNETTKQTKEMIEIVPDWYLSPPKDGQGNIYGTATAVNEDLQYAVNQAVLLAEHEIVNKMASEFSSFTLNTVDNSNGGSNQTASTQQIQNIIRKAPLFGHDITKRVVVPDPKTGEFRVFVQAYLSAKANANVMRAVGKNSAEVKNDVMLNSYINSLDAVTETDVVSQ